MKVFVLEARCERCNYVYLVGINEMCECRAEHVITKRAISFPVHLADQMMAAGVAWECNDE